VSYDKTAIGLLQQQFQERLKRNEPLADHSSAGAGGPADFFLELQSTDEVIQLVTFCCQFRLPLLVIGNGSNVLFTDRGVRGIVACMRTKSLYIEEGFQSKTQSIAEAGMTWPSLVQEMAEQNWGGLEFGVGIPGTLGGAIVTNAGAHNEEIGKHIKWVEVLEARGCNLAEEGTVSIPQVRRYTQADLQMGNRKSRFREQRRAQITSSGQLLPAPRDLISPPEIILRVCIPVQKTDATSIEQLQKKISTSHQLQVASFAGHIGPVFKDPAGAKANLLIEQAGLKASKKGSVQLSPHHSNFLVNRGGASASEIAAMMVEMHQQVLTQTGVDLEVDLELYGE
jgi:UDP-N-acetylmuramate dehydrogenase